MQFGFYDPGFFLSTLCSGYSLMLLHDFVVCPCSDLLNHTLLIHTSRISDLVNFGVDPESLYIYNANTHIHTYIYFMSSCARKRNEVQINISYYKAQYHSIYLHVQVIVTLIQSTLGGKKAAFTRLWNCIMKNILFIATWPHYCVPFSTDCGLTCFLRKQCFIFQVSLTYDNVHRIFLVELLFFSSDSLWLFIKS